MSLQHFHRYHRCDNHHHCHPLKWWSRRKRHFQAPPDSLIIDSITYHKKFTRVMRGPCCRWHFTGEHVLLLPQPHSPLSPSVLRSHHSACAPCCPASPCETPHAAIKRPTRAPLARLSLRIPPTRRTPHWRLYSQCNWQEGKREVGYQDAAGGERWKTTVGETDDLNMLGKATIQRGAKR